MVNVYDHQKRNCRFRTSSLNHPSAKDRIKMRANHLPVLSGIGAGGTHSELNLPSFYWPRHSPSSKRRYHCLALVLRVQ
jgi:hypothetical protein